MAVLHRFYCVFFLSFFTQNVCLSRPMVIVDYVCIFVKFCAVEFIKVLVVYSIDAKYLDMFEYFRKFQ